MTERSQDSDLKFAPAANLESMGLRSLQGQVDNWIRTVGVRYFSELTNLAQLMEEVGELSRVMSRTYGEQSFKEGEQPSDLSDELSDVLFVLICIANQTGVDLEAAFTKNLDKKTNRDRLRHKQNQKLSSQDREAADANGIESR